MKEIAGMVTLAWYRLVYDGQVTMQSIKRIGESMYKYSTERLEKILERYWNWEYWYERMSGTDKSTAMHSYRCACIYR